MTPLPEVVQAYITAYTQKDVGGMLACPAEEIAFSHLEDGEIRAETQGKPAFAELAAAGAQAFETRQLIIRHAISVAETTLVEIDFTGFLVLDLPNGWRTGQTAQIHGASAFHLAEGRIVRLVDESFHVSVQT
ncbi:MAG: nuclear transport factor 2 family protein [Pseudomonadota bacterium]